jgi:lipoprotein-releasing system permease protein
MGALVLGIEVGGYNLRHEEGFRTPYYFLPGSTATLSVLPMDSRGRVLPEQKTRVFPIANQFTSGIYEIDNNTVFVRLDEAQNMLMMDRAERVDPASAGARPVRMVDPKTGKEVWQEPKRIVEPARVTHVLVRGKDGVDAGLLRDRCRDIYDQFASDHANDPMPPPSLGKRGVLTWRDRNQTLISAVEKETALVMFIFGVISLTSVFLVLAIFWAMVSEKTKDIGVLRAIGASRGGWRGSGCGTASRSGWWGRCWAERSRT